jgi:hypothetical protein
MDNRAKKDTMKLQAGFIEQRLGTDRADQRRNLQSLQSVLYERGQGCAM